MSRAWLTGLCFLWATVAFALPVESPLSDPAQEAKARSVFRMLRCVVCQGETIADSSADIAVDMRRDVRSQIAAGRSEGEVIAYFAERYGDSVRMQPPFSGATLLLWLAPLLVISYGGWLIWRYFKRSGA